MAQEVQSFEERLYAARGKTPPARRSFLERLDEARTKGLGERASNAAQAVARGAGTTAAATVRGAGLLQERGLEALGPLAGLVDPLGTARGLGAAAADLGGRAGQAVQEALPGAPGMEGAFETQVAEGLGSSATFLAGGLPGMALKIPAALGIAGLGALAQGASSYDEVFQKTGGDEAKATTALVLGAGVGTSEAIPLARIFHRLTRAVPGLKQALIAPLSEAAEEFVQEGVVQGPLTTAISNALTDDERALFADTLRDGSAGGLAALLLGTLASGRGYGRFQARLAQAKAESAIQAAQEPAGSTLAAEAPEGAFGVEAAPAPAPGAEALQLGPVPVVTSEEGMEAERAETQRVAAETLAAPREQAAVPEPASAALQKLRGIAEDASLVAEERDWTRAVTNEGQRVRHDKEGWIGKVVRPADSARPPQDQMVLVEHPLSEAEAAKLGQEPGDLITRFYPTLQLSPAFRPDRSPPVALDPTAAPEPAPQPEAEPSRAEGGAAVAPLEQGAAGAVEAQAETGGFGYRGPTIDQTILSPSGRVSKRARKEALAREEKRLFPPGYWDRPEVSAEDKAKAEAERLRRSAADLRDLAARGMSPRKFLREAEKLEHQAALAAREGVPAAPAAAEEAQPEPPGPTTGIKNATVDRELAAMKLPRAEHGAAVKDTERHGKAMETLRADPLAGQRLVSDLAANPRPPTGDEGALLALEMNRLIVERDAAQDAFNADPSEENQRRIDRAVEEYHRAANAVTVAGTESSASLRIRKMMIARDYSLAAMERAVRVAKGGDPLTTGESARVKALHDKLAAANKALEEHITAAEAKQAALEAENALLRLKREVKTRQRTTKREASIAESKKNIDTLLSQIAAHSSRARTGIDTDLLVLVTKLAGEHIKIGYQQFSVWAEEMAEKIGEYIRPYLEKAWKAAQDARREELAEKIAARIKEGAALTDLRPQVQAIAEQFVAEGVTEREALIDAVHGVLKEAVPDVTRRQTMDAISGYGDFRQLSKDEIKVKLRDLKGQMQQVAKLEDLEAKIPPKKTGFEHRAPSDTERRLAKQVADLRRKLGIKGADPAAALKAYKTRKANEIAELQERVAAGDVAPRPRKPLTLDEEATRLKADFEAARREFEREKERQRRRNRTLAQKAIDAAKEVLNLPKAIKTAWDFSAVLRQGAFFSLSHPVGSAKLLPPMFRATFSERRALEIDVQLRNRPLAAFGEASKLELTRHGDDIGIHEEAIRSDLSDYIPGVKMSNRAFVTFLNLQRAFMFDAMVRGIPGTPTIEQGRAIANAVNVGTGRGNPGKGQFAAAVRGLSGILWSPRLLLSRFQLLFGQPLFKAKGTGTTKLIAQEYARSLIGLAGVYALNSVAGLLLHDDDEPVIGMNPLSSDFGKIRIGNTRLDPLAGLSQVTVLLSRLATGKKETLSGKTVSIRGEDVPYGGDTSYKVAARFLRTKLSPTIGLGWDILDRENVVGEPVTPLSAAKQAVTPLAMQDIYEAMKEHGVPGGAALGILSIFGWGLQNYGERAPAAPPARPRRLGPEIQARK